MRVVFVGRDRVIWKRIVLSVLTLGISRRVWLYRIVKEIDGHEALGLRHRLNMVLVCIPFVSGLVTLQAARHTREMVRGSTVRYGNPWLVWLATWVPILGNLLFLAWQQSRLNQFWAHERAHPSRGVELDVDLDKDPAFLVELDEAMRSSYHAKSRFENTLWHRTRRATGEAAESLAAIREERVKVREMGGSTPMPFWQRPRAPPMRLLHVTCGRCDHRFDLRQDPLRETPMLCPKCGLLEVLPGWQNDPLRGTDPAVVAQVEAVCPKCETKFHSLRNLTGATPLVCPGCGRKDELPPPPVTAQQPHEKPPRPRATQERPHRLREGTRS